MYYADLYHPPDVSLAYDTWHASCGPVALAAILRCPVMDVQPYCAGYRGYMNPTHLQQVLRTAGRRCWRLDPSHRVTYGLLFLQWTGPWCESGASAKWAYRYTHWVGTAVTKDYGVLYYDINAWITDTVQGAWVPVAWWQKEIQPAITAEIPKAYGGYYVRWACEVEDCRPCA